MTKEKNKQLLEEMRKHGEQSGWLHPKKTPKEEVAEKIMKVVKTEHEEKREKLLKTIPF